MSTLSEIEAAADALPIEQKQELLLFLAERLRAQGTPLPEPRRFSEQQVAEWRDDLDSLYRVMGERYSSGERDVTERHNESF